MVTRNQQKRNLETVRATVTSNVENMLADVICFCELGEVMRPLEMKHVEILQLEIIAAWKGSAKGQVAPQIRCLYETFEPYLTASHSTTSDCRHDRLLEDVYPHPEPRIAQALLCCRIGNKDIEGVDVNNTHAPSGGTKLRDTQRNALQRNLRQINSKSKLAE